jgi:hypothetical protein
MQEIFTITSLVLAIVALIFATIQTIEARKQTKSISIQHSALQEISGSLSTQFIGPFPDFLPMVNKLVTEAKKEIIIVNTIPTPGYFSAPRVWIDYRHAIEQKIHEGVSVEIFCMNNNRRMMRMRKQFPDSAEHWKEWSKEHSDDIKFFLKHTFPDQLFESLDHASFLNLLLEIQRRVLTDVYNGATVREIDQDVAVQMWIVDNTQALFVIQTLPPVGVGYGLITSDPLFVVALRAMVQLYRSDVPKNGDS